MTSPTRPDASPLDVFAGLEGEAPAVRPRRRRRRPAAIAAIVAGAIVLSAGGAYGANAASAELPAASAAVVDAPAVSVDAPALAWPSYGSGAVAAVGMDGTGEGGVLASYGSADTVPIGSIAKVVTALVVLAAKPIAEGTDGDTIAFTSTDVGYYDESVAENGSVAPVSAGLELTEREALTVLMLPSANNYAKSLAIWAYGSEDAYLAAARTWLDGQGLTRTSVTDTSGLSPDTVSTTSEMVRLGELLVADPVLAPIVALPSAVIPGVGTVENTNTLLGRSGVDGIKTGTTDEAGACLLFALDTTVEGQPMTLVGVVVGARTHPQLAADIESLIPSVEAGFHSVALTTAGQDFGSYTSAWGESAVAETAEAQSVLVWGAVSTSTTVALDTVETVAAGERIGTATVDVNGTPYELPLVADGGIEDPGFGWRLSHPAELFG
ncbi:D-alanyl-D-alanine carboxypeptidase [Rathayibacter sp. VKM Ac-2803]|uniref:D-alanyl-D-alanine carboxypeptidase family protein n=1 Tax=Rathayibacter sp. VKM Ac-2803 TaxID=2609256 RepID=UPI00135A0C64|nr:D-alanyl-D-alanine carboxypeptidase [Rathayibacter sp. VKM Ac-2803]MWV49868.1 D-alanyl-D-alanine carboxypeptidase [Rathayibacter sp. VKM Ac-2803]